MCAKLLQSTLYDPMDYSPPDSSVHGIFQAKILEWVAMPSSRGSSQTVSLRQAGSSPLVPPGKSFRVTVAAAAAKSLQSCPTLGDPIDGSPPGSPVPGILQARTLELVAISFSNA